MQDDVTHGSVQFMAACLLPRYLFEKTDCQHGSAVKEETPQGKTLEYKYSISRPHHAAPVFVKPGLCCAF